MSAVNGRDLAAAPGPAVIMRPAFSDDELAKTGLGQYIAWLSLRGHRFGSFQDLWTWSIENPADFWSTVWEYFQVPGTPGNCVLNDAQMPGASWFPTGRINYAQAVVNGFGEPDQVAILGYSQTRPKVELTFGELTDQIQLARSAFKKLGVRKGDRVAGYLPNVPEAIIAMLATASLGATWACCPPEFGARSVIDRLAQLEPTLLLTVGGYTYGAKDVDRTTEVNTIREALPSVRNVISLAYGAHQVDDSLDWNELLAGSSRDEPLDFEPVSFDHPLWTLFSSGTTGLPKAVVHSHGGIALEHLKLHGLQLDTRAGDRVTMMTTTGWTVWNCLVSSLMVGASIVVSDGNFLYPDLEEPWRMVARDGVTMFGTSPGYLMACRKESLRPGEAFDLSSLRTMGATGAVLPAEAYDWLYDVLPADVYVNSMSGGTDICSNFISGNPWIPVYRGEISGPALGADVAAFDEAGNEVIGQVGELVVRSPMPSMPVAFWRDKDMERYRSAYFDTYPGIWRHGDWVTVTEQRTFGIHGRSDSTLNRGGVRLGTAEFYNLVESLPEVQDSLVVHLEDKAGGPGELLLFVQLAAGHEMTDAMRKSLRDVIRAELSPRHVPDLVAAVPAVPRTLTGKKLETPIKKILTGARPELVVSPGAVSNYDAIEAYVAAVEPRN